MSKKPMGRHESETTAETNYRIGVASKLISNFGWSEGEALRTVNYYDGDLLGQYDSHKSTTEAAAWLDKSRRGPTKKRKS